MAALALAGACKSDDGGASNAPQQPTASAAPAPAPAPQGGGEVGQGGGGRRGRQQMTPEERRAERLKQFDSNSDGRLDRQERQAMRQANLDRRMKRMDADGDGRISRQEASAGRLGQRLLADFDHVDADHDSFVSRDELERAADELRAQRRAERLQNGGAAGARPVTPAPMNQDMGDDGSDSLDDEE